MISAMIICKTNQVNFLFLLMIVFFFDDTRHVFLD